jgi:hypothetical protein
VESRATIGRARKGASEEMARQFIIVGRDDPGLYHMLSADWAGDPDLAVILDRRVCQRRDEPVTATIERRRAERRQEAPVEALLTWRGGGATARRADVLATLSEGPASIAVRQRPSAKVEGRTALRPHAGLSQEQAAAHQPMIPKPTTVAIALVALLGAFSGGIFGGMALWLLLTYEFSRRRPSAPSVPPHRLTGTEQKVVPVGTLQTR